jgi:hypothetical protein
MIAAKSYARLALACACIVVSLAAMINVFGDNADVLTRARALGCQKASCDLARVDRTPFAQTYDFRSTTGLVTVRCARGAIFFGEYVCAKQ